MYEGQRVSIYQKPITGEDYEGEAILLELLDDNPATEHYPILVLGEEQQGFLQKWSVRFDDGMETVRNVLCYALPGTGTFPPAYKQ